MGVIFMKKLIVLVSAVFIGIYFMACSKKPTTQIPIEKTIIVNAKLEDTKIETTEEFTKSLDKIGYKTELTKADDEGFLSGTLTKINIGEDTIGLYEYKNNQQMLHESKTISCDGSMVGNSIYEWKAKPHFYKNGNIIVSYFGENKKIIETIEKFMGKQFAGMM